jgi:succinoglycan biosynthesis protein ExoA
VADPSLEGSRRPWFGGSPAVRRYRRPVAPRVTVIVPARDEAAHIEACVRSILRQQVEGGLEVLVVDGRSTDATAELAREAGAVVLDNEERTIPAALNRALAAARGDVIVRFDAHAEMPDGYVVACLRSLEEERAANVGGWREVRGEGPWGRALALAFASPVGVGNARIWRPPRPGETRRDVDTVPLGCFPAETLRDAGGWDERLLANEDFDLNHRLRRRGGRVVFDPEIRSVYRPRETLGEIAAQYRRYGRWKAAMLDEAPGSIRPRQLVPPALLLTAVAAVVPSPLARPARAGVVLYAAGLAAETIRVRGGWRLPIVLATMHLAWGGGLLAGLARPRVRRGADARPPGPTGRRAPASP